MLRRLFGKKNDEPTDIGESRHSVSPSSSPERQLPIVRVELSYGENEDSSEFSQEQRIEFHALNDSKWEDYFTWWSSDKSSFSDFTTWARVRKVVHTFWNLDTKIRETYAQRDLIGAEQTIPLCREQMALAPMAKVALEVDHKLQFEWDKSEHEKRKKEWERYFIGEYTGWKPIERPFDLPEHRGFKQLAIIYDKMRDYQAAIDICDEALGVDWPGDWQVRIARYQKRLDKANSPKSKSRSATSLPSKPHVFCTDCGNLLAEEDFFCGACGARKRDGI